MIYDTLNNLPNYLGISDNLDTAIEYIMARDIQTLPIGRTQIDGDKVFVNVAQITPQPGEKVDFAGRNTWPSSPTWRAASSLRSLWGSWPSKSPMTPPPIWPMAALPPALPACSARDGLPSSWQARPTKPA